MTAPLRISGLVGAVHDTAPVPRQDAATQPGLFDRESDLDRFKPRQPRRRTRHRPVGLEGVPRLSAAELDAMIAAAPAVYAHPLPSFIRTDPYAPLPEGQARVAFYAPRFVRSGDPHTSRERQPGDETQEASVMASDERDPATAYFVFDTDGRPVEDPRSPGPARFDTYASALEYCVQHGDETLRPGAEILLNLRIRVCVDPKRFQELRGDDGTVGFPRHMEMVGAVVAGIREALWARPSIVTVQLDDLDHERLHPDYAHENVVEWG